MKKLLSICLVVSAFAVKAQTWNTEEQYIQRFAPYAVEEMELYKVPASITLAQGLIETAGGQSRLAQEGKPLLVSNVKKPGQVRRCPIQMMLQTNASEFMSLPEILTETTLCFNNQKALQSTFPFRC